MIGHVQAADRARESALQFEFEDVFAVHGKVVARRDSASRAEGKVFAEAFLLAEVRLFVRVVFDGAVAFEGRGHCWIAHGLAGDFGGCGDIAIEQRRFHLEGVGIGVEAVGLLVGREHCLGVDIHGDQVCRTLVASECRTRVLMLTASSTIADRVEGLGLGADDYLAKPFAFAELTARIRALARRSQLPLPPILEHRDVRLDPAQRVVTRAGQRLALSPKELAVLEYLLAAQGRVVSAEELLERVWDEAADPFTSTVKVTIRRLRSKLGDPPLIETVAYSGYRI